MKDKIIEILKDQVSIRSTKSCMQIAEEINTLYTTEIGKKEIDKLWKRFSFTSETVDDDGEFTGHEIRLMTKPEFELAINALNNNQP